MIGGYLQILGRFDRNVRLYLLSAAMVGFTTSGGIFNVLLNLYLLRLGFGLDLVGVIVGAGALLFALCCLPAGILGRRWGSRRAMIVGMSLMVLGNALIPAVEYVPVAWRAAYLLLARLPRALGFALYLVNSSPFLMGATDTRERTHVFSVQAALLPLMGFAGSLAAGFLPGAFAALLGFSADGPAPYRCTLFLASVLLLPSVLVLLATREVGDGTRQDSVDETGPAPVGPIVMVALVTLLMVGGVGAVQSFFNVYLDQGLEIATPLIGALLAVGQLLGGMATLFMPLVSARWGPTRAVVATSMAAGLCILPVALIPHWFAAGVGFVLASAFAMMRFATFVVYQQEMVAVRWRALMSGAGNMAAGASFAAAALVGGYMIPLVGYSRLFLLATGLLAAGSLLFWAYFRVPRGEYARSAGSVRQ